MAKRVTKGKAKIKMSGRPRHRTKSLKKIRRRIPSGKIVVQYKHKKHSKHVCAICKEILHGRPRGRPAEIKKLAKSKRAPTRPFGGMLCPRCSRKIQSLRARLKFKVIKKEDVPLSLLKYMR